MVDTSPDASKHVAILPCVVEEQRFGLLASDVLRIVRAAMPVRLPNAPASVLGLLNLHGALLPVFDVRAHFRLPPRPIRSADHLVIARAGARTAAVVVDAAEALLKVPASSLHAARLLAADAPHLSGVATLADGSLILYDLAAFLSPAESGQLDDALAARAEEGPSP